MEVIQDRVPHDKDPAESGEPYKLQLDSAYEAEIVGIAVGRSDQAQADGRNYLKHAGESRTLNEVEFLDRERRYGKLVTSRFIAETAQDGFEKIVSSGEAYQGITPDTAGIFLQAIAKSRQQRAEATPAQETTEQDPEEPTGLRVVHFSPPGQRSLAA